MCLFSMFFMIIFCFWSTILWFEMKLTHKWHLYNHFWPFSCHLYVHLSKNRGWVVTLRCLTSLNLNWYKSYDTKHKNEKKLKWVFLYKTTQNRNENICILLHIFWTNQNLDWLCVVMCIKMTFWTSVFWKIRRKMAKYGQKWS